MDKRHFWSSWMVLTALAVGCSPPAPQGNDAGDAHDQQDAVMDAAPDVITDAPIQDDATDTSTSDADRTDGAMADVGTDGGMECTLRRILVGTSDGMTGGYVVGTLSTRMFQRVMPTGDAGVPQDHVVRTSGCTVFDLHRTWAAAPNSVAVLDPDNLLTPRRVITLDPVPTGPDAGLQSANPHDVAVVAPGKAYVTQYNSPELAIVDPVRGVRTGTISLAPLADGDGIPEAESVVIVGNRAYVSLQQLARPSYMAPAQSTIAVIDTTMDRLIDLDPAMSGVQGIRLSFGNPMEMSLSLDGRYLLVVSVGNYSTMAGGFVGGGVDVIDLSNHRVVRFFRAMDLGGEPSSVVAMGGTQAWVAVRTERGSLVIKSLDHASGMVHTVVNLPTGVTSAMLRRDPEGNVWVLNTAFGMDGEVYGYRPDGMPLLERPYRVMGQSTTSMDFIP